MFFLSRRRGGASTTARVGRSFYGEAIPAEEYGERRRRLFSHMRPNTLLILPAADELLQTNDILHEFRQDTIFYHLFGLSEPMRRSLSPHSCNPDAPEGFNLTCAVLAKYAATGGGGEEGPDGPARTATRLYVPERTSEVSVLPWGSERRSHGDFHKAHFSAAEPNAGDVLRCNSVECILSDVTAMIADMATSHLCGTQQRRSALMDTVSVRPSTLRAINPLPTLYLNLTPQVRWSGEIFRMRGQRPSGGDGVSQPPYVAFTHPIEALLQLLYSLQIDVVTTDGTDGLSCRYQQLSNRPLIPCFSTHPDHTRRAQLRELYPDALSRRIHDPCAEAVPRAGEEHEDDDDENSSAPGSAADVLSLPISSPLQLPTQLLWEYRLRKSPSQVAQHLRSAAATHLGFVTAMAQAAAGATERAIHMGWVRTAQELNSAADTATGTGPLTRVRLAYVPVVAAGASATEIHYTSNTAASKSGDWMRLDGGYEVDLVPTDCTRSFPMGPFDGNDDTNVADATATIMRRRALYEGVLHIQRTLIQQIHTGVEVRSVSEEHLKLTERLLADLGVGQHRPKTSSKGACAATDNTLTAAVRDVFCAHTFGHFFGLDIHESAPAKALRESGSQRFVGGVMHTVEPGVYVPVTGSPLYSRLGGELTEEDVPGELRGVGLQVEDDVLVLPAALTASGHAGDGPWRRKDYLDVVRRTYDDLENNGRSGSGNRSGWCSEPNEDLFLLPCLMEHAPLLAELRRDMSRECWIAVLVVFLQRISIEGLAEAVAALPADTLRVTDHFCSPTDADDAQWYPFDVVVLTAFTPKDLSLIAYVQNRS